MERIICNLKDLGYEVEEDRGKINIKNGGLKLSFEVKNEEEFLECLNNAAKILEDEDFASLLNEINHIIF
jgi:hypothetical protein